MEKCNAEELRRRPESLFGAVSTQILFSERVKRIRKCWWRLGGCKSSPGATTLQGDQVVPDPGAMDCLRAKTRTSTFSKLMGRPISA
jgi:hypothetical protein